MIANVSKFVEATADPEMTILSVADQLKLQEQKGKKSEAHTARARGAAEDACDNNYLIDRGSQHQAKAHVKWKAELSTKRNIVRAGLMRLPLTGKHLPQLHFSSDPPVRVYMWDDGYIVKQREVSLVLEGLRQHPAVELVGNPESAQLVVWPTVMGAVKTEFMPIGCKKVVVIDGGDGCNRHPR